ncbi:MAG TPA: DNA polymerase Y family protein, partial [Chitinophagaceae bacterium]|nr:DNA polymerase Y family protein [Chitinophagaceae bacterium]
MQRRFASIWFPHLTTDWFTRRQPELKNAAFVLSAPYQGRMIVTATNALAQQKGVYSGMVVADARALVPSLRILDNKSSLADVLLKRIAEWCIRFSPFVSLDAPHGLLLDVTGCTHLWGGDWVYINDIIKRLQQHGYTARVAIADTIGAAWAVARFSKDVFIVEPEKQVEAIATLPPEALRIDIDTVERLNKLGLRQVKDFLSFPRYSLRRRFGARFTQRLHQAIGIEEEIIQPIFPVITYQERLPCFEPISTRTGIEIALDRVLSALCGNLEKEEKGIRAASFNGYRIDGKIETIQIGTTRASNDTRHLYKLFELKLEDFQPAPGIELFTLEAIKVEEIHATQKKIWKESDELNESHLSELLDRLSIKLGAENIYRFAPQEHHLPERSFTPSSLQIIDENSWKLDRPRPIQLLSSPEPVDVTAPIPDYPPMLFRYKGKLHKIIKADGPERI